MVIYGFNFSGFGAFDCMALEPNTKSKEQEKMKYKISISGMHCSSCASNTEKSLKKILGVKNANVSLMTKKGIIEAEKEISDEELRKAVSKVGYKITGIERE